MGYSPWGRKELDTTEVMQQQQQPANAEDKRDASTILGQEDPLDEEMATHSSILAWRILGTEEPDGLQSMGSQRVRHD